MFGSEACAAASGEHGEVSAKELRVEPGVSRRRRWPRRPHRRPPRLGRALLAKILDDEEAVALVERTSPGVWSTHLHERGSSIWSSSRMMRKEKSVRKPPTTACLVPCHAEPTRFGTEGVSRSHD